jgi:hypothetical protein
MSNAKCREQRRQIQLGSTGQRATKTDGSRSGTRYACNENDPEPMKPGPYRVRKGVRASPCASIRPRLIRSPPASDPSFLLVAMGARVYDPYTGTFTQPDPIPGADANSYGYADGDPVNETDLTGREIDPDLGGSGDGDYADPETGGGGVSAADETTDRTDATLRDLRGGLNPPNLEVDTRADLEAVFEKLSEGGTPFQSGYAGSQVQLDDGTIVGLRDVSRSGDSTVDVDGRPGGAAKGRPNVNIHITRR